MSQHKRENSIEELKWRKRDIGSSRSEEASGQKCGVVWNKNGDARKDKWRGRSLAGEIERCVIQGVTAIRNTGRRDVYVYTSIKMKDAGASVVAE